MTQHKNNQLEKERSMSLIKTKSHKTSTKRQMMSVEKVKTKRKV